MRRNEWLLFCLLVHRSQILLLGSKQVFNARSTIAAAEWRNKFGHKGLSGSENTSGQSLDTWTQMATRIQWCQYIPNFATGGIKRSWRPRSHSDDKMQDSQPRRLADEARGKEQMSKANWPRRPRPLCGRWASPWQTAALGSGSPSHPGPSPPCRPGMETCVPRRADSPSPPCTPAMNTQALWFCWNQHLNIVESCRTAVQT